MKRAPHWYEIAPFTKVTPGIWHLQAQRELMIFGGILHVLVLGHACCVYDIGRPNNWSILKSIHSNKLSFLHQAKSHKNTKMQLQVVQLVHKTHLN